MRWTAASGHVDLKPLAPSEIAGPWKPIATNVPGIEIGELLPKMATMMDRFVPIRSLVGAQADHDATQCFTGRPPRGVGIPTGGWPQFGSIVSKIKGPVDPATPPYVSLCFSIANGVCDNAGISEEILRRRLPVVHSAYAP